VSPVLDGRVTGQFPSGRNHDPGICLQVEILPLGEQLLLKVVGLTETRQVASQYEIGDRPKIFLRRRTSHEALSQIVHLVLSIKPCTSSSTVAKKQSRGIPRLRELLRQGCLDDSKKAVA
jgi:hypothetical protein